VLVARLVALFSRWSRSQLSGVAAAVVLLTTAAARYSRDTLSLPPLEGLRNE
jgi:hypothetical protein